MKRRRDPSLECDNEEITIECLPLRFGRRKLLFGCGAFGMRVPTGRREKREREKKKVPCKGRRGSHEEFQASSTVCNVPFILVYQYASHAHSLLGETCRPAILGLLFRTKKLSGV